MSLSCDPPQAEVSQAKLFLIYRKVLAYYVNKAWVLMTLQSDRKGGRLCDREMGNILS